MNKATIYINGVIGEDSKLLDVIRQFKSFQNPTEVSVHIDSVGGCVDTGMSIFNYLRNLNIPVTTIAKQAYSIAASIYMAGDVRIVSEGEAKLMIHMPFATVQGGSKYLDEVSKELKSMENDFVKFYSTYTSIDEQAVRDLLENETFISGAEAYALGLATQIEVPLKAVAYYNSDEEENKQKEMSKTQKFMNALNAFFNEVEVKALVIQDANANEINFKDLAEDAEPQVGDKAEDGEGKPVEGEVVLTDGSTWIFEGGELKEIVPAEEVEEEEVPVEETEEEVVAEETVEAVAEVVEEEFDVEALVATLTETISAKITAELKEENDGLKTEIKALKKLVGSEETILNAKNETTNTNNNKSSNYLRK